MFKYIEIKEFKTKKVVKRIDVSGETDKVIDRLNNGMNINLNTEEYYTIINESKVKLYDI